MSEAIKTYHVRIDGEVLLYNLGDVHRGDEACDVSTYLRVVDKIKNEPRARWVSTGDLLNVALKSSKSSVYHSANIQEEMQALSDELAPIADKCLGFVGSNHHRRLEKESGLSLDYLLSTFLDVPYLGDIGSLVIHCGRMVHWIGMHHTTGGGATAGAKANKQERLHALMPCLDVYLSGHTHTSMITDDMQMYPDYKRGRIVWKSQIKATTGHFLDYEESYAAAMMLPPKPKGATVVRLQYGGSGNLSRKKYRAWLEG